MSASKASLPSAPSDGDPLPASAAKSNDFATGRGRLTIRWDWATGGVCLVLDAVVWVGIYQLCAYLRHFFDADLLQPTSGVALGQLAALAVALFIVGGYDRRTDFMSLGYMSEHFITMVAAGCLGIVIIYAGAAYSAQIRPSRSALLIGLVLFAPASLMYRRTLAARLHAQTSRHLFLVLGAGDLARLFYRSYSRARSQQSLRFVDLTLDSTQGGQPVDPADPQSPLIEAHSPEDLAMLAANTDGVIVLDKPRELSRDILLGLTRLHFDKTPVYTLDAFYETQWRKVPVHALDPIWPLEVSSQLASQSIYAHIKRLIDVTLSVLALILLTPLLALLTALTWYDSGRPVIFRQTRVGKHGEPFTIYKFRTMHTEAPGISGSLYTLEKDPRVTSLGKWLRKLRLDELPQLWNVFKGDMSLMGPRAEWNRLASQYEAEIPYYHFRHLVKPGVTGWAQVNYPYGASREDAIEKLKYDLYYIRHCSLRLDAMIVLKTLHIMLWGKGL